MHTAPENASPIPTQAHGQPNSPQQEEGDVHLNRWGLACIMLSLLGTFTISISVVLGAIDCVLVLLSGSIALVQYACTSRRDPINLWLPLLGLLIITIPLAVSLQKILSTFAPH